MTDFMTYDPGDFTVEELRSAARGYVTTLSPQIAVVLLREKLGENAEAQLIELARDDTADTRGRHAATLALGSIPSARDALLALTSSSQPLVAEAAAEALGRSE